MEIYFLEKNILFQREKRYKIIYKNNVLHHPYIADFVVYNSIIIEVKFAASVIDAHIAQTLNYLRLLNIKPGIIINFGEPSLKWQRVVL